MRPIRLYRKEVSVENLDISATVKKQREFFSTHRTKDIRFRMESLKKLREAILSYENRIYEALHADLRKSKFEAYETEFGLVLIELRTHIRNLVKWAKPKRSRSKIYNFFSSSYIYPDPYGVVLIIAPWNYPFKLLMDPLIGALSAGNCVALKPAAYSKNTSHVIAEMISEYFSPDHVSVFPGGREVNQELLNEPFDYLFFTGSPSLGKVVMEKAAKNLTPVTLELGGKNPCIVDSDADIDLAARRVAWGRFLNAGQTCVAPDYLFIQRDIKAHFLTHLKNYIIRFFGPDPFLSEDYARIINEQQFDRIAGYLQTGTLYFGGQTNKEHKYISPTILTEVPPEAPVMQEEIFGPVVPVMEYEQLSEVIDFVNSRPKPLSLYFFSADRRKQKEIIDKISFGGGCINETIMHITNTYLPYGGVGNSGMGAYHGKNSFDTFTHYKSLVKKSNLIDITFRYAPYEGKMNLLKKLIR